MKMYGNRLTSFDALIGMDVWLHVNNFWIQFVRKVQDNHYKVHALSGYEKSQYGKYAAEDQAHIREHKTTMLFNCRPNDDYYTALKNRDFLTTDELFDIGE